MRDFTAIAIVLILSIASVPLSSLSAAEGVGCEHYALQEDAQSDYERWEFNRPKLDPDGNGVACEELPSAEDILPKNIAVSHVGRFIDGSFANQVKVSPDMTVTLAGLTDGHTLTDSPVGTCQDALEYDPLADVVPKGVIVFVTDADGKGPDLRTKTVASGIVWVWDGVNHPINVNVWLIRNGLAVWDQDVTPESMLAEFTAADQLAKADKLGVWGDCNGARSAIVATFAPLSAFEAGDTPQRIVSLSGDWGDSSNFKIPTAGTYTVTVRAPSANSYIEIAVIRHLETGQEFPEFYSTFFGPDIYSTTVYFPAGTYLFDCRAAGGWFFSVETAP